MSAAPRTEQGRHDILTGNVHARLTLEVDSLAGQVNTAHATQQPALSDPDVRHEQQGAVHGPLVGPAAPPSRPDATANGTSSRSASPYSLNRSIMRDLTLPPVPNLDIPPSPPGTPPPSTTAKFTHFLELKKQGVHFNEKLARSSALKNPSLLQKLMDFAGISEPEQYATALPEEIWNPVDFPPWAYKEELAKSQQEILTRKDEEKRQAQRQALEFVPAGGDPPGSRASAEIGRGGGGRSAAERVMAGLDRERSRTPNLANGEKRRQTSRRGEP